MSGSSGSFENRADVCRVLRDEPRPTSPFSPTGSQSSVLRRVRAKVIGAGAPPVGLSEQEALTELLR